MIRLLGIGIALLLIFGLAYPFARDAYRRYEVAQRLNPVMNAQERAEFRNWNGDAFSFARRLYERCELTQGRGAAQCERYNLASE